MESWTTLLYPTLIIHITSADSLITITAWKQLLNCLTARSVGYEKSTSFVIYQV